MNDKLKEYLKQSREKFLLEKGLYDMVEIPDEDVKITSLSDYVKQWDTTTQQMKYYQKVPIEISDEEYKLLRETCVEEKKKNANLEDINNTVASALCVIAWIIYIVAFIAGIGFGIDAAEYYSEFNFIVALIYWVIGLISGTMFLGFAEIIKLLEAIKRK